MYAIQHTSGATWHNVARTENRELAMRQFTSYTFDYNEAYRVIDSATLRIVAQRDHR